MIQHAPENLRPCGLLEKIRRKMPAKATKNPTFDFCCKTAKTHIYHMPSANSGHDARPTLTAL
jgi:hypothetical protein